MVMTSMLGCGVPQHDVATTVTNVPYDLLKPEPRDTATSPSTQAGRPFVYFVHDQMLVAVATEATPTDPRDGVVGVLARLAQGPSEQDRSAGLATALGPDTAIRLASLDGGVARIDIAAGDQVPAPARVPLAVAQIVLTVTSVPGVDAVLATRDGDPVELPVPGGALTADPVGAADYAVLVGRLETSTTDPSRPPTVTTSPTG